MKLVIQIPCLNEAEALPATLAELPREVAGFETVEWQIVDDGSTDGTAEVARAHGVDHVVRLPTHMGLAAAFMAGIEAALRRGADVIVNTDADNQYDARCIPDLVAPILDDRAQIVVGARPIETIRHFSPVKKAMQKLGSWVVRVASGTDIADAPSGFRAIHREAALQLNVFNRYTYTLETIIQAGHKAIPIVSVPVRVNGETRPSRLMKSSLGYVIRSMLIILRIFVVYSPFRFFGWLTVLFAVPGMLGVLRFLAFYAAGNGAGKIQSLVLSGALLAMAAVMFVGGLLADMIAANRMLLEGMRTRQLRAEIGAAPQAAAKPRAPKAARDR